VCQLCAFRRCGAIRAASSAGCANLTPAAFGQDRRRDAALLLAGYRVVRFTYRQVVKHPDEVAGILRALLGAHRA
jgi:hypothetical protein